MEKKKTQNLKTCLGTYIKYTVCPTQKKKSRTSFAMNKCENSEVLDSPNYHSMNEQEQLDLEEEEIEGDGEEEFLDFQVGGEIRT